MATVTNKRKALTASKEQLKVTQQIEKGAEKADACRKFGLVNSTIQKTWKGGTKIISIFQRIG